MNGSLSIDEIIDAVTGECSGVAVNTNWGERGLFYNPDGRLPKGIYLLTFKEKDGPNDKASAIDRGGIYRLNLGIGKARYQSLFGAVPARPAAGEVVDTGHDFQAIDVIMPHPVYAWMSWIGVLNPGQATFDTLLPMIRDSVESARVKYEKRLRQKT